MLVLLPVINETYHTRFYHSEGRDAAGRQALSMLISPSGFRYAIFDEAYTKVTELCHVEVPRGTVGDILGDPDQLGFLLNNYRLPESKFTRVNIALLHADFTLMPVAFSEGTDARSVLEFTGSLHGASSTGRHRVSDLEFCFSSQSPSLHLLEKTFSSAVIRHAGAVTIELFMSHRALNGCNVFLNVHDGLIELAARVGQKLVFYNVFNVATNEDILYYLLFMAAQFNLDPQEMVLGIGGLADEKLLDHLHKYTGSRRLLNEGWAVLMPGKAAQLPLQYYFTLLNQHQCEL